ncbi:MAG: ABC transporter ATP-binding protein [Chloroflexota bacterium]
MIELANVSFSYGESATACLEEVSLQVKEGECVLLCGKSGCGKSTILNLINGIIPNHIEGRLEGRVFVNGIEPKDVTIQELSGTVGSVFQNPKSQFFSLNSSDELLFACCNHKVPREVMLERLEETAVTFNMPHLLDRNIFDLSGGEKQKLACASVYMNRPKVYVFDEPSANLDATAIEELKQVIQTLKAAGHTVLIAEHRLYYLADLCDRVLYIDEGKVAGRYTRQEFIQIPDANRQAMGLRMITEPVIEKRTTNYNYDEPAVKVDTLRSFYGNQLAVDIENLNLPKNKVIALIGKNGAGKSTFAASFCGILKADDDVVDEVKLTRRERVKRSFMVMQDVNHQLFAESVLDELMLGSEFDDEVKRQEAEALLEQLNLLPFRDHHPQSLSGGQKQRTAIASALFTGKKYLIFDEPTSGVDLIHMNRVAELIHSVKDKVDLVLVITHDKEFINRCCEIIIELRDGKIISSSN